MEQLQLNLGSEKKLLQRRPDYTFKYNTKLGRHGWLRLTPAYSVKLVTEILSSASPEAFIFDPFSGTGTTPLVAAEKGFNAIATDINPFLIWFGKTKTSQFSTDELRTTKLKFSIICTDCKKYLGNDNWTPDIFNINRWWTKETLSFLSSIRKSIVLHCGEPQQATLADNLIWISFCRLVIETSSAAFNHVSMSFKDKTPTFCLSTLESLFREIFAHISENAKSAIRGKTTIKLGDARKPTLGNQKVDLVITSPPYPNRMSYIRELRPYMYWTKFLNEAKEAGEIDWKAIGGTWGTATSKLKTWTQKSTTLPKDLVDTCELIANADNKNGFLMKQYVLKYFDDINLHIKNLRAVLNNGAQLHYIIGNSNFYSNCVNAETLLMEIFERWGYKNASVKIIRKRNSNKKLFEYCVTAQWEQ